MGGLRGARGRREEGGGEERKGGGCGELRAGGTG